MPTENILELVWALFAIIIVLGLAYVFTKYVAGRFGGNTSHFRKGHITVLEQIVVGKDQKLMLVRVGESIYFLAMSQGSITCIKEISKEEMELWDKNMEMQTTPKITFQEALRKVIEQRKK